MRPPCVLGTPPPSATATVLPPPPNHNQQRCHKQQETRQNFFNFNLSLRKVSSAGSCLCSIISLDLLFALLPPQPHPTTIQIIIQAQPCVVPLHNRVLSLDASTTWVAYIPSKPTSSPPAEMRKTTNNAFSSPSKYCVVCRLIVVVLSHESDSRSFTFRLNAI